MALADLQPVVRNDAGIAVVLDVLGRRFGDRFQTGGAIRAQHAHTTTYIPSQPPDGVVFPASTEEVQEIVRICAQHRVPVIPFGAGTSLEGHVNAPGGGISIDLTGMDAILAVNAEDLDCIVQPGVTREGLNAHLRDTGLFFPIDPGANASLGGMAATRASGTNAVRYGTIRDNVLSLTAVMADGGIGEVDLEIDLKMIGRGQAGEGLALAHLDRTQHADGAQRLGLHLDPRAQDTPHEGRRRAVENRNLGAIDADQRVMDAGPGQRGHDMFDRGQGHALPDP